MPAGRPTEYSDEMLVKANEYLDSCYDDDVEQEAHEEQEPQAHGGSLRRIRKPELIVRIPTKGGMARHLGVSRDTLYEWAKQHQEFSDIMEWLGSEQEDRLINNGLSGAYNPTIAKLLLSKHGYVEKSENDLRVKELPTPILKLDGTGENAVLRDNSNQQD